MGRHNITKTPRKDDTSPLEWRPLEHWYEIRQNDGTIVASFQANNGQDAFTRLRARRAATTMDLGLVRITAEVCEESE
jgi:hypothetical protein